MTEGRVADLAVMQSSDNLSGAASGVPFSGVRGAGLVQTHGSGELPAHERGGNRKQAAGQLIAVKNDFGAVPVFDCDSPEMSFSEWRSWS